MEKVDRSKSRWWELLRFLICGVAAALSDYLAAQLIVLAMPGVNEIVVTIVSTAVGFVVGVIVNYLISTFWVYQNVDKSIQTKSKRFITMFVILSFIAAMYSHELSTFFAAGSAMRAMSPVM